MFVMLQAGFDIRCESGWHDFGRAAGWYDV
jgi:hypothetical protein